jgi:hypothetical protein
VQVVSQLYMILGSFDILGNPVSLLSTLGRCVCVSIVRSHACTRHSGVYDFFYEPARGGLSSPAEFGIGLARGTSSLVCCHVLCMFCEHIVLPHTPPCPPTGAAHSLRALRHGKQDLRLGGQGCGAADRRSRVSLRVIECVYACVACNSCDMLSVT